VSVAIDLETLAARAGVVLERRTLMLAIAESCTGGALSAAVTAVPGSSRWFERGFVCYSNEAKRELLGVSAAALERHGAVSEAVALEMAEGALARSRAQAGVAVTGIAGPGGGSAEKPVGTVWLAWALAGGTTAAERRHFSGDRAAVRARAVAAALEGLIERLA